MKTILCIALFMMTTITFAQEKKNTKSNEPSKATPSSQKEVLKDNKTEIAQSGTAYVKFEGVKGESKPRKSSTRRRVEVLKSNKQGDPNKK